jgi:hypothetical protein
MAAFAFWAFIASCVVGGIWYSIREKQAQHETLRRIIESGKDVDAEVIERVMNDGSRRDKSEGELKVAGYITMSAAPGLVLLGYFVELASGNEKVFTILLGVAGLVFFVSIGLLVSAKVMERSNASSNDKPLI